jgi:hypothetical protein
MEKSASFAALKSDDAFKKRVWASFWKLLRLGCNLKQPPEIFINRNGRQIEFLGLRWKFIGEQ